MHKNSINEIFKKISKEASARKAEGSRFSRQDRLFSKTPKGDQTNPLKQETRLYCFAKKFQHKIRKYVFYGVAYNMAYKFKQFIPKYDERIGIDELLQYHDEEFIKNAYQGLLGREPDSQGFHHYVTELRNGNLSKTEILAHLRYSKEGKEKKITVRGLLLRSIIESSYRIPVIGYVFNLMMNLMMMPRIMRHIREFEAFTNARFSKQVDKDLTEEQHLLDALYVAFEDRFRGNREDIKERARVYLPYIEKSHSHARDARVLDIGCGRGEWLELLLENGYSAQGIDTNRIMVKQCRDRGLDVVEYEALRFLREQAPGTFSVVTGLHIVEHLPLPALIQLLDEVVRILRSGGIAIFETPNPENMIVGATFFHIDPTHGNPVHPLTMDFLLGQRGFSRTEILRLHAIPSPEIENKVLHDLLFGPQDFAAIGYKQ